MAGTHGDSIKGAVSAGGRSTQQQWSLSLIHIYPELADKISTTVSPMCAVSRMIKAKDPDEVTVFIGPCVAKKSEVQMCIRDRLYCGFYLLHICFICIFWQKRAMTAVMSSR